MRYGAVIGAAAAVFKIMAPKSLAPWSETHAIAAIAREIVGAALAFALICGVAAAARNVIVGRLMKAP